MFKTLLKSIAIIASCLFLISCASTGNQNLAKMDNTQANNVLVDGKTTKSDVKLALGEPDDVDFSDRGDEKWTYQFNRSKSKAVNFVPYVNLFAAGTNDLKKKIVILFDEQGVVKKHNFSESTGQTKVGVFG